MVRAYKVKGRKRTKREENYDRDEEDVPETERPAAEEDEGEAEGEGAEVEAAPELEGIPIAPSELKSKKPNVTFVLERASLEVAKVGKSYQILNSDDHANFLRRNNKNPADFRPDIVHQALLSILDSTINKAGRIRAIYVRTDKGVLFEVNPHVRLPRTYKRFSGVMLQLLQKLSISVVGKREKLLRVVKNPVTQYLPVNSRKIGFSHSSDKVVKMRDYVRAIDDNTDLVFMVGSMAHGKIDKELADDYISVSGYPLSVACCIFKICESLADKWDIL